MNKLIAVLYALYLVFFMIGCMSNHSDYEIHMFMDRDTEQVTGYVEIDGVEHKFKVNYDEN